MAGKNRLSSSFIMEKKWNLEKLESFSEDKKKINVIIESPRGSAYKFDYDTKTGCFKLFKELQTGTVFPFDFGFIPGTIGDDGDPLDVMVLMEKSLFSGCLVECKIIGVVEVSEKHKGKKTIRNDRFMATPDVTRIFRKIHSVKELDPDIMDDIMGFLKYYTKEDNKHIEILGVKGPDKALALIKKGIRK